MTHAPISGAEVPTVDVSQWLFLFAAACNIAAAIANLITARRNRRSLRTIRETSTKAIGFTAFMASPEAGAPDEVRRLALRCLPEGATVTVEPLPPDTRVH